MQIDALHSGKAGVELSHRAFRLAPRTRLYEQRHWHTISE
jgi:hypothetical protein